MFPMRFLLAILVLIGTTTLAAAQDRPAVRVVYFVPTDRKPEPDHVARLDRVMTEVQRFYREGMKQNGHGPLTFNLERDEKGTLKIHEVAGKGAMKDYSRTSSGPVREEVKAALAKRGIDVDREHIIIFQLLLEWKDKKAIELGAYVGGGDARAGTAWVYDDVRLDPKLLPSKDPGGYYHGPCSLGQFNTHYIGGTIHELGHALGLPHERERDRDRKTKGHSLMGAGNHTYGQELRGEGMGTFLTPAAALPLSVHPLFTGKPFAAAPLTCQLVNLQPAAGQGTLRLTGAFEGGPPVIGLVAYNDPKDIPGDYDAWSWTCPVDKDGRFDLLIEDLRPGEFDLRLRAVGANGQTKTFPLAYRVSDDKRPAAGMLLEAQMLRDAETALAKDDGGRLAALLDEAKKQTPANPEFVRKIEQLERLRSPVKLKTLAEVPAATKSVAVSDLVFESASTGWGPALRNRVKNDGAGSLIVVGGELYESGLYAHAPARHAMRLGKEWKTLTTRYGLQDGFAGSVVFVIKGDGRELFRSPVVRDRKAREQSVDVGGVDRLELIVENAGDGNGGDWGVWLNPRLER